MIWLAVVLVALVGVDILFVLCALRLFSWDASGEDQWPPDTEPEDAEWKEAA